MKIGEFLKHSGQRLVMCLPDTSLAAVAKLMYEHGIGAMPVCERGTRMIGIISERDLAYALGCMGASCLKSSCLSL